MTTQHGTPSDFDGGQCLSKFYTPQTRQDQKSSLDVTTDMLQIFYLDAYAFLDLGEKLFFVTLCIATRFGINSEILIEPFPFLVSTSISNLVIAKQVYKNYSISIFL